MTNFVVKLCLQNLFSHHDSRVVRVVSRLIRINQDVFLFINSGISPSYTINKLKRDRDLTLVDFGCRWVNQLWWVTDTRTDLENSCGHIMTRGQGNPCDDRQGLDNHSTVRNVCHSGMGSGLLAV